MVWSPLPRCDALRRLSIIMMVSHGGRQLAPRAVPTTSLSGASLSVLCIGVSFASALGALSELSLLSGWASLSGRASVRARWDGFFSGPHRCAHHAKGPRRLAGRSPVDLRQAVGLAGHDKLARPPCAEWGHPLQCTSCVSGERLQAERGTVVDAPSELVGISALRAGLVPVADAALSMWGCAVCSCFPFYCRVTSPLPPPQLFAEDVRYFLPAYQRNYCWKQETAVGFLQQVLDRVRDGYDELHSALEVTPEGHEKRLPTDIIRQWTLEQIPESIGFIVLYRGREDGHFGVIDGQQRMVTLGFIFAALRECFLQSGNTIDEACAEEMHDRIWQRPHFSRGLAATARLTVRRIDVDLYHRLCLVPGGMQAFLDREADNEDMSTSESHSKMIGAQRIILDTLMEQPPCVWRMLASYLSECQYNMLLSQDAITALKMFGSLNFKGAEQMGAVDRFRSAIVMEDEADLNTNVAAAARAVPSLTGGAPARVGSLLEPVWDELQSDYGRQFIATAVLRAIQCRLGLLEGKHNYWQDPSSLTLADKYDAEARLMLAEASIPAASFFCGPFSCLLKEYRVVERASLPGGAHGNAVDRLLQSLKGCTLVAWEPVAYAFMRTRLDDDGVPLPGVVPEIEAFLLTLDRFAFYVLLVEGGVQRLARLNAVLEAVTSGKDPLKLMVLGTEPGEARGGALLPTPGWP